MHRECTSIHYTMYRLCIQVLYLYPTGTVLVRSPLTTSSSVTFNLCMVSNSLLTAGDGISPVIVPSGRPIQIISMNYRRLVSQLMLGCYHLQHYFLRSFAIFISYICSYFLILYISVKLTICNTSYYKAQS